MTAEIIFASMTVSLSFIHSRMWVAGKQFLFLAKIIIISVTRELMLVKVGNGLQLIRLASRP